VPFHTIDLSKIQTYPLRQRDSRVGVANLVQPAAPPPAFSHPELNDVISRIVEARLAGRPVIWMFGGHVVKRGLSLLLIDLMERGVITHLASNGAATIHDFELAYQGQTSEDVARSLEDGSFGMAEETGAWINQAIKRGARAGLGLGEALGRMVTEDHRFSFRQNSLLAAAYRLGIPYTVHVAIGTDIVHQHPEVDFAAIGWASGQDFKIFCSSVSALEGGVFCNFGSAVIGPEVFLKAISIVRNLGHEVKHFTTANFDLIPLEDYRRPIGDDQTDYYYRPRKNIVNRPVAGGGRGFHINGDHNVTIPNLYAGVLHQLGEQVLPVANQRMMGSEDPQDIVASLESQSPAAAQVLRRTVEQFPDLKHTVSDLAEAFDVICRSFITGGTLFTGGNGGSMADAIHISGELDKAFMLKRPVPEAHRLRLSEMPGGEALAQHLQVGLPTIPLGINTALSSAVDNDINLAHIGLAQELYALAKQGDVFLGISTSGNAQNVCYAATVARLLGVPVIALTGAGGGRLAEIADITVHAPAVITPEVQGWHIQLYHALCEMLEAHFFTKTGS
jgi:phosphoheptose isomerase